jgi:hypothetical protein
MEELPVAPERGLIINSNLSRGLATVFATSIIFDYAVY